jgi:hypothetical protein
MGESLQNDQAGTQGQISCYIELTLALQDR